MPARDSANISDLEKRENCIIEKPWLETPYSITSKQLTNKF